MGTSGYQYPEWKGSFYPETFTSAKMLPYYAERFPTTEINYSFYRIPTDKTLANWATQTPATFRFSFKAPRELTHTRKLQNVEPILSRFTAAIEHLDAKLGVVLFQLPPFFKKDLARLREFLDALPRDLNCAFEFRHASWFDDDVFSCLQARRAALCLAESEKLSTPIQFTADFGYFRLRREDYTGAELTRWAGLIAEHRSRLKEVYVYFKHEERGVGPRFARQLLKLLN